MQTSAPHEDEPANPQVARHLRKLQRRLVPQRIAGWLAQACLLWIAVLCVVVGSGHVRWWLGYVGVLVAVATVFHLLPGLLWRWLGSQETRVEPGGDDAPPIGRYTGAEILTAFERATGGLPSRLRRIRVRVAKVRGIQAWTALNLIWPGWGRAPAVTVSSGALHYLEQRELEALLLHEVGHHVSRHRLGPPGGWLLADLCLASVLFCAHSALGDAFWRPCLLFLGTRGVVVTVVMLLAWPSAHAIEHACDLFAASRLGPEPIANVLLKLGEECELTEAVLALAARRLLYAHWPDVDDLRLAFEEVRPEGRIFHENLFRHSVAVVQWLLDEGGMELPGPPAKRQKNTELAAFLDDRRKRNRRRIRGRRYDADGDGALSFLKLYSLVTTLGQRPDFVLVAAAEEDEPTTHPSFRDRLVALVSCACG